MISVAEARALVFQNISRLPAQLCDLRAASGCILAEEVVAPFDVPLWAQSAVDGYAFAFSDWKKTPALPLSQLIAAGDAGTTNLIAGTAARIFTGAALPPGADTVVMQEQTTVAEEQVLIQDPHLVAGANVRPAGSEIRQGDSALPAGTLLTPAAVGFLAMLGISSVQVYPKPRIALLITGKELQEPGTAPEKGKVFEANSYTLIAALEQLGLKQVSFQIVEDRLEATVAALARGLRDADVVMVTGGISVGDFDYVLPAALACGVQQVFHKVKQKPGKPLFFGIQGSKPVFGLPGNPASVLSCFYQYVVPALATMMQREDLVRKVRLPLSAAVSKKPGLTHFLKARVENGTILPLLAQESYRLSSFARANCLVEIPEGTSEIEAGSLADAWLF